MKVTKENFDSLCWIKSDLSIKEYAQIKLELDALLLAVTLGEIPPQDYVLEEKRLFSRIETNSFMFGSDYDLFLKFMLSKYKDKEKAALSAAHEKAHADFLVEQGVRDYHFGLKVFQNGGIQPFVYYSRLANLEETTKKEKIDFFKGFISAPEKSMSQSDSTSLAFWENQHNPAK